MKVDVGAVAIAVVTGLCLVAIWSPHRAARWARASAEKLDPQPPPAPVVWKCQCDLEGIGPDEVWTKLVGAESSLALEQTTLIPTGAACGGPLRIRPHLY